jgi:cell division protein FtsB
MRRFKTLIFKPINSHIILILKFLSYGFRFSYSVIWNMKKIKTCLKLTLSPRLAHSIQLCFLLLLFFGYLIWTQFNIILREINMCVSKQASKQAHTYGTDQRQQKISRAISYDDDGERRKEKRSNSSWYNKIVKCTGTKC